MKSVTTDGRRTSPPRASNLDAELHYQLTATRPASMTSQLQVLGQSLPGSEALTNLSQQRADKLN
jgi:hypothetical protein